MAAEVVFKGTAFPESLRWHEGELWFSDVLAGVAYRGDVSTGQLHIEAEIAPYVSGLGWLSSGVTHCGLRKTSSHTTRDRWSAFNSLRFKCPVEI